MKFMLISDNHDTLVGMRLAGIEGILTHDEQGIADGLKKACDDENIAVVLITKILADKAKETIDNMKLNSTRPLIVVIPDRHGNSDSDSLSEYISEAMGISL